MGQRKTPKLRSDKRLVADWNTKCPPGTLVAYWLGVRTASLPPNGTAKTRSEAQLLGGHSAVVWVEGVSGAVALSHIKVLEAAPA
jgi:hypothetical protein